MKHSNHPDPTQHFKSITIMLATQCMIYLGEIANPINGQNKIHMTSARLYIDFLKELEFKTKGNLDDNELHFLVETIENLELTLKKKSNKPNEN